VSSRLHGPIDDTYTGIVSKQNEPHHNKRTLERTPKDSSTAEELADDSSPAESGNTSGIHPALCETGFSSQISGF